MEDSKANIDLYRQHIIVAFMQNIVPYKGKLPVFDENVFVAPNAFIIGDVSIGAHSSVWYGCAVRGDERDIKIGKRTNIQDNTVIHVAGKVQGTYIGDNVTIGHGCIIHACTIGHTALIGMQSCILDGARVEDNALLAAGSLLTPGKTVPSGQLWGGRPAKYIRDLTDKDFELLSWSSDNYVDLAKQYI
jgi:carbonic anhydrase/acetyltransferase-like protein (isoleucine patch superfamily)